MSISIAIIEDIDEVRQALHDFIALKPEFHIAGMFKTAEGALVEIPFLEPDIVIMDINLPGITGIECIRQLKPKIPRAQFMMFTVYEDDENVFEALKAGASGYLLKNTGMAQITEALKDLHNGGSPMSVNIARKLVSVYHKQPNGNTLQNVLSVRENEILQHLSKGLLYKEIADKLSISVNTVRHHIHNIYEKLHAQNRTEALNKVYGSN
jgi:DNA-binding NarL/FixJ family response regulator